MQLEIAREIAEGLVLHMAPHCDRIEIAGSIRREKPDVRDIEIVCIPTTRTQQRVVGLFGETEDVQTNLLYEWAQQRCTRQWITWVKTGTRSRVEWNIKPDGKQWRASVEALGQQIYLDVFLTTPEQWGTIYLIRTGSSDFNTALMAHAKRIGRPCAEGYFSVCDVRCEAREEADVFDLLGLRYVEPKQRINGHDVKKRGIE